MAEKNWHQYINLQILWEGVRSDQNLEKWGSKSDPTNKVAEFVKHLQIGILDLEYV